MMTTEAELRVSAATARLVHFQFDEPVDEIVREDEAGAYRIDLCLTPRPPNARACYRDHWSLDRFEPIGKVFMLPPAETETVQARSDIGCQTSIVCRPSPPSRSAPGSTATCSGCHTAWKRPSIFRTQTFAAF